jgi:hypothetical protein
MESHFESFWTAPVVDAFKDIYVPISWQVMSGIIRVCHYVGGMMGSSAQIGLWPRCLACEGFERGRLPGFKGELFLWRRQGLSPVPKFISR